MKFVEVIFIGYDLIVDNNETTKLVASNNSESIQDVSEIRVLILTSERTRQFMNLFSITFSLLPIGGYTL
jgi:glycerol-3-phosphate O-acyltransferase